MEKMSNYEEQAPRFREAKKSFSNLPSPKTRRSSVNPKKGIRSTARSAIRERIPLRVPPPIAAMLSLNDFPSYKPIEVSSRILKQPKRTAKVADLNKVG